MKFKKRLDSPLLKKAHRGFRGYPVATVAYYGPDDTRASKVAVGIVLSEEGEPLMERFFSETGDVRRDRLIEANILRAVQEHGVKTVIVTDGIIGCPHEEGIDYPDDATCPQCPFWETHERMTGEPIDRAARARALADMVRNKEE